MKIIAANLTSFLLMLLIQWEPWG
eukprot:UN05804